jgi:predicted nuclease of predicted toxin-antitoxin system
MTPIHASELGMERASDTEIIDRAKQASRTVITADLDYSRLLAVSRAAEPSLVLFRGGNWSEADVMKRMGELLEAVSITDIEPSVLIVERKRVRRRRLPIGD